MFNYCSGIAEDVPKNLPLKFDYHLTISIFRFVEVFEVNFGKTAL
jgi:hypothetical protein